jgi:SAM-dependent methyltransferase
VDLDEYRRTSYETWERMAPGWQRRREFIWETTQPVSEWLIHALDPTPGDRVLELAAGLGDTGLTLARMLGDHGHLILTDFSPNMIEAARQRAAELGIRNVEYRVMDAEHMDIEDESVDDVLCRWGFMLMANPGAALRETRRVLKPGGRLAFAVWDAPDRNPWSALPGAVMVERGHVPPPEPGAPGMFALADHGRVKDLLKGAGFKKVKLHEIPLEWRFEDFDQYWTFLTDLAGGFSVALEKVSEEERQNVRQALAERLEPFRNDGGYRLSGVSLGAVAR